MINRTDIDLEIVDAGVAYTLYSAALVNLAIQMNAGADLTQSQEKVVEYSDQLYGGLVRCGIEKGIPTKFTDSNEVVGVLKAQSLVTEITNLLVQKHSRRQENIFLFTVLLGGVFTGELGGVEETASTVNSSIRPVAKNLNVPDRILKQCLQQKRLTPFRDYLKKQITKHQPISRKWYERPEFWIGTIIAFGCLIVGIWQLIA